MGGATLWPGETPAFLWDVTIGDTIMLIGLIAGSGVFPQIVAKALSARGLTVVAVAQDGETDPALQASVDRFLSLPVGQLDRMIAYLKSAGVTDVVMAGGVKKANLFQIRPDARLTALLGRLESKGDDALLVAFANELGRDGISVRSATDYLPELIASAGEMTRPLLPHEWRDIRFGWPIAKAIGQMEIGQCVVVRDGVVLAVEAIEGTSAAIRRGGAFTPGSLVIKVCKPQQDLRFDLPAVGLETINAMKAVAARVLVVEAGRALLFDQVQMLEAARVADIAVVGWAETDPIHCEDGGGSPSQLEPGGPFDVNGVAPPTIPTYFP